MAIVTKSHAHEPTHGAGHHETSHRLRDFLLYIAIGTSLAVLAIILGVHQAKAGQKAGVLLKWIGFAVMTLLVFWWTIRTYRGYWSNSKFWKLLSLSAVIHLVLGVGVLLRITMVSLFPFVAITPLEYLLLSAYLSEFLTRRE